MSGDREEVQEMLDGLVKESAKAVLKVNINKTKIMCNSYGAKIRVGEIDLETVEEYTYLGHIISFKEKMGKKIERRIIQAWKGYWALKLVFKGSLKISSKIRMFEACFLPVLLYEAQTWTLTKAQTGRLVTTQRAMERSILGIKKKERIRATKIREVTKCKNVVYMTKKLKMKYAGHLARMVEERWPPSGFHTVT